MLRKSTALKTFSRLIFLHLRRGITLECVKFYDYERLDHVLI